MQAWESFLTSLSRELGGEVITKWLRPLKVIHFDACNLYLEAEDNFQIEWFEEHIRLKARQQLRTNSGQPLKIHLTTKDQQKKQKELPPQKEQERPFVLDKDPLFSLYTEETLLFSSSDLLLQEIFRLYTRQDPPFPFNPLFFYGPPSTGKTHLLQALTHALQKRGSKALYVKTETFTQNMIQAIKKGTMQQFRESYRLVDALLVDDVQQLGNKHATQEEFFHTFNTLHTQGKLLIFTSDQSPRRLEQIEPRLISRFEWGLSLPLQGLSQEELPLFIRRRCETLQLSLKENAIDFLIEHFSLKPAALQKALDALCLRVPKESPPLSSSLVKTLLKDLLLSQQKEESRAPDRLIEAVAHFYGLSEGDILGKSQKQENSFPRQFAMYLCRSRLKLPFKKIGQLFGRDHSTVMTSVKRVEEKLAKGDQDIENTLASFLKKSPEFRGSESG